MKISIVTISYNQAHFIEETILSVLDQSYRDIEYIIVDAGSTDGSRDIIQKYKNEISKIIFEPDKGQADGLNKGFYAATGEIFGFINSDDLLISDALSVINYVFEKNPTIDTILGEGYKIDDRGNLLGTVIPDRFSIKKYAFKCMNFIQPSMFFRRTAFFEAGGFNVENHTCWDGELLLNLGLLGKNIKVFKKPLSKFRIYSTSISGSGSNSGIYLKDRERLFIKAMKRERKKIDQIFKYYYLFKNSLCNPLKIWYKFF